MQLNLCQQGKCRTLSAISFLMLVALFFSNCRNEKTSSKEQTNIVSDKKAFKDLPSDFITFYEKFHQDSTYQMAHIQFPLEGYPAQVDSATVAEGTFRWYADTWRMHKMAAFSSSEFIRTFEETIPGIINETIRQKGTPYALFRRFYKRDNEWFLILYLDMNPMDE